MSIQFRSDRSNQPIPAEECSTLKVSGPLKSMLGRSCVHLGKAEAAAFCRWIGVEVNRPDMDVVPGPEPVRDAG